MSNFPQKFFPDFFMNTLFKGLSPLFTRQYVIYGGGIRGRGAYRGYMGGYQGKGL